MISCSAKKVGSGPDVYLRHYALACHRANEAVSGALEPLYRLHASRLKLLLLPNADLRCIARYCFNKSTIKLVLTLLQVLLLISLRRANFESYLSALI